MATMSRSVNASSANDSIMSPGSSEAGSAANDALYGGDRSRMSTSSANSARHMGSLQGAGISSLNLSLGQDSSASAGPSMVGFNAISTLLNDPKKPQRPIDPSSSRYPAISQSHTELPKIKRSEYDASIKSVRAEWDRYKRSTALGIRGKATLHGHKEDPATQAQSKQTDAATLLSMDDDAAARALGNKRLPPLSTVPQVFFSEEFDMGNPYTFDLVTERYKAASSGGASSNQAGTAMQGYDVALNQMLQEKMSYYSDVVEQHLILEISARSTSFFAALGNLQDLEAESRSCLEKVEGLKTELNERDEGIAKTGLTIVREQAKRREIGERLEAVGLLHQLCEKRDLCHLLIQNSEWSEALDVLANLAGLIAGTERLASRDEQNSHLQPHVDLDLASIPAVQAMAPQLHGMRESIAAQLEVELLSMLTSDISTRTGAPGDVASADGVNKSMEAAQASDVSKSTAPDTEGSAFVPKSLESSEELLAERLKAHITGLVRTDSVDKVLVGYKDALLKAARSTMRSYLLDGAISGSIDSEWLPNLATLLEDDEAASGRHDAKLGPGGVEAASRLREMPLQHFVRLLQTLLLGLTQYIKATEMQRRVFVKLLDDRGRQMQRLGEEREDDILEVVMPAGISPSLPTNMSTIVADVCSLAHVLASRLLSLRSSAHVGLSLEQFLEVFHLAWAFVLETESTCGRMIIGLRGVILNQAKAWLANFHRQRIEKAAKAVEEEQWAPTDVSSRDQKRVLQIVESATADPKAFLIAMDSGKIDDNDQTQEADGEDQQESSKTLEIDGKEFWLVPASLDVLKLLADYLGVVINLPLLTTEVMGRVVEFLKQFNSRTCQVVLGAGAMRSAGLKNITARHLALASQSLSVMVSLIPYVREAVRRHLNARQAVMLVEFDKLKRDFQEHQYEIHSKLVAIMGDRLTVHCRSLANWNWTAALGDDETEREDETPAPIKPIADLIRETTVLHKRLCTYLQPSIVEHIIGQVLTATDERIGAELRKIEGHDDSTKRRAMTVKEALDNGYSGLRHVQWSSKIIAEAVEEIKKREPPVPPSAPVPAPPETEKVKSPTLPPAYKPRLNIFARRQQQQQQAQSAQIRSSSPATDGRPSIDTSAPMIEPEPQVSSETVGEDRPSGDARAELTLDTSSTIIQEPTSAALEGMEGQVPPFASPGPDSASERPPPTPEKDHRGSEFSHSVASPGTNTPEQVASAPATPSKNSIELPAISAASAPRATEKAEQSRLATPRSSAPPSSATPGRLTLQQRLAEAARKRAQAATGASKGQMDHPVQPIASPSDTAASTSVDEAETKSRTKSEDNSDIVPVKSSGDAAEKVPEASGTDEVEHMPSGDAAISLVQEPKEGQKEELVDRAGESRADDEIGKENGDTNAQNSSTILKANFDNGASTNVSADATSRPEESASPSRAAATPASPEGNRPDGEDALVLASAPEPIAPISIAPESAATKGLAQELNAQTSAASMVIEAKSDHGPILAQSDDKGSQAAGQAAGATAETESMKKVSPRASTEESTDKVDDATRPTSIDHAPVAMEAETRRDGAPSEKENLDVRTPGLAEEAQGDNAEADDENGAEGGAGNGAADGKKSKNAAKKARQKAKKKGQTVKS